MLRDTLASDQKSTKSKTGPYLIGFGLSLLLTLAAYTIVYLHVKTDHLEFSHSFIITTVVGLALIQFFVQLVFFLHLGRETKPRWNLMAFLFMMLVVIIVVFGSYWIMNNLNYHNRTPNETDSYIHQLEGL